MSAPRVMDASRVISLHFLIYYYVVGKEEALAIQAERKAESVEVGLRPVR